VSTKGEPITIYTDGACRGNPGPGGWAAVLMHGAREKELVGGEPVTTNNRMELMAAISGLEALKRPSRVELYTDSRYVIDGITQWIEGWKKRGWKKVANRDLWERLAKAAEPHEIAWRWVAGHSGDPGNDRVDKLATMEADRAGEKDDVRVRAELDAKLEVECALAGQKDAQKKAPAWCVRGPGNTGVHCLTGSGKERCPHAFIVMERTKLILRDKAGGRKTIETDERGKGKEVDEVKRILGDIAAPPGAS
jgi:ribonuclease HI